MLCSHKEIYIEAVRDLNALYQARGYPAPLFMSWCKKNSQECWEKWFSLQTDTDQCDESVLVLKTRFDDVWNWFSATELGNTITDIGKNGTNMLLMFITLQATLPDYFLLWARMSMTLLIFTPNSLR